MGLSANFPKSAKHCAGFWGSLLVPGSAPIRVFLLADENLQEPVPPQFLGD